MCHRGKKNARGEAPGANLGRSSLTAALTAVSARVIPIYHRTTSSVLTGRAKLAGFRVGFRAQNPSLLLLRLWGFGLSQALGFFGLCKLFLLLLEHA